MLLRRRREDIVRIHSSIELCAYVDFGQPTDLFHVHVYGLVFFRAFLRKNIKDFLDRPPPPSFGRILQLL